MGINDINPRSKTLFSIIIPVYNRREELRRCLSGVQKQSFPYFEALIIDDASEVPIKDIVENLNDERFKYFRNKKNGGPYNARTVGWKVCKGDYVVNIDSDWEPFPWMLERIIFYFDEFPEADAVTGMHLRNYDSKMFVRVLNGYRLITPKEFNRLPTLPDCVGVVKHFVIDEWLQKSRDYFASESHQWLTFSLKHIQLYVDEPWTRYYLDSPNRATLLSSRTKSAKLVNDCLLFLNDHDEILRTNFCSKVDEALIKVFIVFLRNRHWDGVRESIWYLKIRHKGMIISMAKVLLEKFLRKLGKIIRQEEKTIWI